MKCAKCGKFMEVVFGQVWLKGRAGTMFWCETCQRNVFVPTGNKHPIDNSEAVIQRSERFACGLSDK